MVYLLHLVGIVGGDEVHAHVAEAHHGGPVVDGEGVNQQAQFLGLADPGGIAEEGGIVEVKGLQVVLPYVGWGHGGERLGEGGGVGGAHVSQCAHSEGDILHPVLHAGFPYGLHH